MGSDMFATHSLFGRILPVNSAVESGNGNDFFSRWLPKQHHYLPCSRSHSFLIGHYHRVLTVATTTVWHTFQHEGKIGTPTKRQVSKRQFSKRLVSTRLKRQVYKTSGLQNVRFTKRQVSKTSGCKTSGFKMSTLVNITKCPFSKKYIDLTYVMLDKVRSIAYGPHIMLG